MNDRFVQKSGPIHFSMESARVYVSPGSSATIQLGLTNLGSDEDIFTVSVTGLREEYTSLETPQIRLAAGEYRNIDLIIRLPASPNLQTGEYTFELGVTSQNKPAEKVVVEGN